MTKLLDFDIKDANILLRESTDKYGNTTGWRVGAAITIPDAQQDILRINFKLTDQILKFKNMIHSEYCPGTIYEEALDLFHSLNQVYPIVYAGVGQAVEPDRPNNEERTVLNNTLVVIWQAPGKPVQGRIWVEDWTEQLSFNQEVTPNQRKTGVFAWARPIHEVAEVKKFTPYTPVKRSIDL